MDGSDLPPVSLQESAREWHRLQLAALAFVGLCGVLKGDAGQGNPLWLETLAGVLVLAALVCAVAAIGLVLLVAWPLSARGVPTATAERRLRVGIALTVLSFLLTAVSASSAWWPQETCPDPIGGLSPSEVLLLEPAC